jgi:hypothetical protein
MDDSLKISDPAVKLHALLRAHAVNGLLAGATILEIAKADTDFMANFGEPEETETPEALIYAALHQLQEHGLVECVSSLPVEWEIRHAAATASASGAVEHGSNRRRGAGSYVRTYCPYYSCHDRG